MSRRPTASIVASPVLIGAVTLLVTIVAVFLAYNANTGLPFVPTYDIKAQRELEKAVRENSPTKKAKGVRVGAASVRPTASFRHHRPLRRSSSPQSRPVAPEHSAP